VSADFLLAIGRVTARSIAGTTSLVAEGRLHSVFRLFFVLLTVFVLAAPARSQQDDDDKDDVPDAVQVQTFMTDANFDQWIFQNDNQLGIAGARQRLDQLLALRIDYLDRACKLTDAQKMKLKLAGRGDIKRFVDLYEKVKRKFQLVKNDQQKLQGIWQDLTPLQMMWQFGLFDEDSFLGKSLRNTLTTEQFSRYDTIARERRAFRHRAQIEAAVVVLEQNMPFRDVQRREFVTLLSNLTKPPHKSGLYSYQVLMYQLSQLPEEKLKPLFDDAQWKIISQQFNNFKGMRQWLKQSGQLPDEDDVADKTDTQPADRNE
jgi:hypothetical protein